MDRDERSGGRAAGEYTEIGVVSYAERVPAGRVLLGLAAVGAPGASVLV